MRKVEHARARQLAATVTGVPAVDLVADDLHRGQRELAHAGQGQQHTQRDPQPCTPGHRGPGPYRLDEVGRRMREAGARQPGDACRVIEPPPALGTRIQVRVHRSPRPRGVLTIQSRRELVPAIETQHAHRVGYLPSLVPAGRLKRNIFFRSDEDVVYLRMQSTDGYT